MNQNDTNSDIGQVEAANGTPLGGGFNLDDIYYIVFRRKWVLLGFACLGVIAAVAVSWIRPPKYGSVAKVMVRYVVNAEGNPSDPEKPRMLESGSESAITSEIEILTSLDVAEIAAGVVGPEKILAKVGGGNSQLAAAGVIKSGLEVSPPRSTVLTVTFRHPDAEVVQPVLRALLDTYTQRHSVVRLGHGNEYYIRQRDELREKLAKTEEQIKELKAQAKLPYAYYQTQIEKQSAELFAAETELASARAVVGDAPLASADTNGAIRIIPPAETVKEYSELVESLATLKKQEQDLLLKSFTAAHPQVRAVRDVIERYSANKAKLEEKFPNLGSYASSGVSVGTNSTRTDIGTEFANIKRLTAKVDSLRSRLSGLEADAISVMNLEPRIAQLERQRQQEEKDYQFCQTAIEQEAAGAGKLVHMSIVQSPTPPGLDRKKLMKLVGAAFAGCFGMGVALAFLIDLVLDRTIRRATDVKRHLRAPLFISIPDITQPKQGARKRVLPSRTAVAEETNGGSSDNSAIAPWDQANQLRPFAEGLRERVITHFEVNNVLHKPKLIGVTGCTDGSGVTTLASGLAAALSKTGEGNVLLVDMNAGEGEAHSFYKGKPGFALAEVLHPDSRADAKIEENLYLASLRPTTNDKLARVLPSHFMNLVPKLKASDYDYIIFDMPHVTPTSVTPRLASYMDMVLLVLESEKTPQQLAGQAGALLAESRANAAVVLNKRRRYVPQVLSHET